MPNKQFKLFKNAKFITLQNETEVFDLMLTNDKGEIEFIGNQKDFEQQYKDEYETIDLKNKFVMPSFINLNTNLMTLTQSLMMCDVSECLSLDKLNFCLTKYNELFKDRYCKFILAIGLDDNLFNEESIKQINNNSSLNKPIILCPKSGNKALINNEFINMIKKENKDLSLKNVCDEQMFNQLAPLIPNKTLEDAIECCLIAQSILAKNGITTCQENIEDIKHLDILTNLSANDANLIDIVINLEANNFKQLFPLIKDKLYGYSHGLRVGGLHITLDGRIENQAAWLNSNYEPSEFFDHQPNYKGALVCDKSAIEKNIEWALSQDTQISFEANGNEAASFLLDFLKNQNNDKLALIKSKKCYMINALLENKELNFAKLIGLSILNSTSDIWIFGEIYRQVLNQQNLNHLFINNSILAAKLNLVQYQNFFLSNNIFELIWSATNRKDRTLNVLNEAEVISVYECLKTLTSSPSELLNEASKKGLLVKDMFADFIVLDQNPLTMDKRHLSSVKVLATYKKAKALFNNLDK